MKPFYNGIVQIYHNPEPHASLGAKRTKQVSKFLLSLETLVNV